MHVKKKESINVQLRQSSPVFAHITTIMYRTLHETVSASFRLEKQPNCSSTVAADKKKYAPNVSSLLQYFTNFVWYNLYDKKCEYVQQHH